MSFISLGELVFPLVAEDEFSATFNKANKAALELSNSWRRMGWDLSRAGLSLAPLSAAVGAFGAASLKAAADFETGFTGVLKTVDLVDPEEIDALSRSFRQLSLELPATTEELTRVGEIAGQLGIAAPNIVGFTRVMTNLGQATADLDAETAADKLARFTNVAQEARGVVPQSVENFERLGSALVHLGNNFAATEGEIVKLATRMAGSGELIGLAQDEILAYATALTAVGIRAEMGGTAISKEFITISAAVSEGGKKLKQFADITAVGLGQASLSAEEFATMFRTNAAEAVLYFVAGLNTIKESGGDVLAVFREIGINEVRLRETMAKMTSAAELLNSTLEISREGWESNTKLTDEVEKRYATLVSMLGILRNHLRYVLTEIGQSFLPTIKAMITGLQPLMAVLIMLSEKFATLPEPLRLLAGAFVAILAAVAPLILALSGLAFTIGGLVGPGGVLLATFVVATAKIGALIAVIAGGYGLVYWLLETTGAFELLKNAAVEAYNELIKMATPAFTAAWENLKEAAYGVYEAFGEVLIVAQEIVRDLEEAGVFAFYLKAAFVTLTVAVYAGIAAIQLYADYFKLIAIGIRLFATYIETVWGHLKTLASSLKDFVIALKDFLTAVGGLFLDVVSEIFNFGKSFKDTLAPLYDFFKDVFESIYGVVIWFFGGIYRLAKDFWNAWTGNLEDGKESAESFGSGIATVGGGISEVFFKVYDVVKTVITAIISYLLSVFPVVDRWVTRVEDIINKFMELRNSALEVTTNMGRLIPPLLLMEVFSKGGKRSHGDINLDTPEPGLLEELETAFKEAGDKVKKLLDGASLAALMEELRAGATGKGGSGGSGKSLKEEIDETGEAANNLFKEMSGFNDMVKGFDLASAFEKARHAGIKFSDEALAEIAVGARNAIEYMLKFGLEVPDSLRELAAMLPPISAQMGELAERAKFSGIEASGGLELLKTDLKAVTDATDEWKDINDQLIKSDWDARIAAQTDKVSAAVLKVARDYEVAMNKLNDSPLKGTKAWDQLAKSIEEGFINEAAEALEGTENIHEALSELVNDFPPNVLARILEEFIRRGKEAKFTVQGFTKELDKLVEAFRDMKQIAGEGIGAIAEHIGTVISAISLGMKSAFQLGESFQNIGKADTFKGMAKSIPSLITGLAGIVSALDAVTQSANRAQAGLYGAITGASMGGSLAIGLGASGGWGMLIGGTIGLIYGLWQSNRQQRLRAELEAQEREQFAFQQHQEYLQSVLDETRTRINDQLGDLLERAEEIGMKVPEEIEKVIREMINLGQITEANILLLDTLASAAEINWKKVQEIAEKYGINQDALGQQYQQLRMDDLTQEIIDDIDLLLRAGVDIGTILEGMQDEISTLVQEAIKFGTTIPENMRPWIENLFEAGLLVDENGDALEDLSGIQFGDAVATEFEKIQTALLELVDAIRNELIPALNALNDWNMQDPSLPQNPSPPDGQPPGPVPDPSQPWVPGTNPEGGGGEYPGGFAIGTKGRLGSWYGNFGGETETKLHGTQAVINPEEAPTFAAETLGLTNEVKKNTVQVPVREKVVNYLVLPNGRVLAELVLSEAPEELIRQGVTSFRPRY